MATEGLTQYNLRHEDTEIAGGVFVSVDTAADTILFKFQNGPIKENGKNGCQIDTAVEVIRQMLWGLNDMYPCTANEDALWHLDGALKAMESRTKDREARNVEGTNAV